MARIELKHWLVTMLLWPALAHAEIEQRQVVSAIKAESGKGGGDVLTLASEHGCGGRQVRMDAMSMGAFAMPEVGKLGGCEPQACTDGKARLYLNHNLTRGEVKEHARYALVVPLPPGKTPGTWQVEVVHAREGEPKRLIGQVNDPDYLRGKLVGNYSMYYPHGQLEMQVEQDGRGVQQGVQTVGIEFEMPEQ